MFLIKNTVFCCFGGLKKCKMFAKSRGEAKWKKKRENPSGRRRRPEKINNEWNSTLFGWSELGLIIGLGTVGSTVVNHLLNHIRRNVVSSSSVLVFSLNIEAFLFTRDSLFKILVRETHSLDTQKSNHKFNIRDFFYT